MRWTIIAVAVVLGVSAIDMRLAAQGRSTAAPSAPAALAFEVASIKPNKSGPMTMQRIAIQPGDRVTITNITARTIVQVAYQAGDAAHVVGGPDWINDDRFDIAARAGAPATTAELRVMLQTLLADRFHLAVHTESRQQDVYALRVAKADGTLGPNLHHAAADCATLLAATHTVDERRTACGTIGTSAPPWHLLGIPSLAQFQIFRSELGRPVVDKTGLTGPFDLDLTWTPLWFADSNVDRSRFPAIDPDGPNIFTAVQEQLGLKLVAEKDEQPMVVIDRIEHPTEN